MSDEQLRDYMNPADSHIVREMIERKEAAARELAYRDAMKAQATLEAERLINIRAADPGEVPSRARKIYGEEDFDSLRRKARTLNGMQRPAKALIVFITAMQFLIRRDLWRAAMLHLLDKGFFNDFTFACEVRGTPRGVREVADWFKDGARPTSPLPMSDQTRPSFLERLRGNRR